MVYLLGVQNIRLFLSKPAAHGRGRLVDSAGKASQAFDHTADQHDLGRSLMFVRRWYNDAASRLFVHEAVKNSTVPQ